MGGKLLNGNRMTREEYDDFSNRCSRIIHNSIGCCNINLVKCPSDKCSFGDIDFIVYIDCCDISNTKRELMAIKEFTSFVDTQFNSISFLYNGVQCDVTICESELEFDYLANYMAYGDAGMFFGRLARVYDLKFGIDGLEYVYREKGTEITRILLSKDFIRILSFLGYVADDIKLLYTDETVTYEKLKEFLFSSIRIDQRFLSADSENTKHRKRDRTRSFFSELYQYMQDNRNKFPEKTRFDIPLGPTGIDYIESWFPESNLLDELTTFKNNRDKMRKASKHFGGGHILKSFPNVTEKNIGQVIAEWEHSVLPTDLGKGSMDYKLAIAEYKLSKTKKELLAEVSDIIENLDQDT